jgi:hypothetical protein
MPVFLPKLGNDLKQANQAVAKKPVAILRQVLKVKTYDNSDLKITLIVDQTKHHHERWNSCTIVGKTPLDF